MKAGRAAGLALAVLAGAAQATPMLTTAPDARPGLTHTPDSRGVIVPRRGRSDPAMPVLRPRTDSRMPVIHPPAAARDGDKVVVPR